MIDHMPNLNEKDIQKKLLKKLIANGYEQITLTNQEDLELNFKKQVEKFNQKILNNQPLTSDQFTELKFKIFHQSVFDSAKILRKGIEIKDQHNKQKRIHLDFINVRQYCQNHFQIISEFTPSTKNYFAKTRYDVILLINGFPIVLIELKSIYTDISKAFRQIKNEYVFSLERLCRYVQFFVVSNSYDTRYFAHNENLDEKYIFEWKNHQNQPCQSFTEFIDNFLNKCHVAKMITHYMVLNNKRKQLMILRPYQIYAVEALVKRAQETNNNGYVWHATGSGKTLTAFKLSQILHDIDVNFVIIFLVDRRELDQQTTEAFNEFGYNFKEIDYIEKTSELKEKMRLGKNRFLITTIQKMSRVCTRANIDLFDKYQNKKVIFIIDECHRSQAGEMHDNIKNYFSKNVQQTQFLGFTGTPIFNDQKKLNHRITENIFGKCCHEYSLFHAIQDQNVLKWNISYFAESSIALKWPRKMVLLENTNNKIKNRLLNLIE